MTVVRCLGGWLLNDLSVLHCLVAMVTCRYWLVVMVTGGRLLCIWVLWCLPGRRLIRTGRV